MEYTIRLNTNIAKTLRTGLKFVRGDRGIVLNFIVDGLEADGTTSKIVFRRNNSTSVESDITAEDDGIYSYTTNGYEFDVPGIVRADLKFYDGESGRVSTASFMFEVYDDTLDGIGSGSGGYSDQLERLTAQLEGALEYYEEAFAGTGALIAKGTYSSTAIYDPLNLVYYDGSSWVCRQACSGQTPAVGQYWQLLISGGGGSVITIDDHMDTTSENPVQNKVITAAIADKLEKVDGATEGNFVSFDDEGGIEDSGHKASDFLTSHQDISGKVDKVTGATSGHFASLTSTGGIADSGLSEDDFLGAEFANKAVASADGVHDFRYYGGNLQYKNGESWSTIPTGGGSGGTSDYEQLTNKPSINGNELSGNKTTAQLGINVPTKVSDLTNDTGFITASAIPTDVSDFNNDAGYITSSDVPGVVNNLTSTSTTDALAAAQGKALNDGKEDKLVAVSKTGSVTFTVEDGKEYTCTSVTSLHMTGANVDCIGTVTFGSSTPTVSVSGFVDMDGDDITSAAASETWEFNVLNGRCLWKNWG